MKLQTTKAPSAFTLMELLVVIAIIASLAALLLGPISRTKDNAKGIQCMSHLRQLGIGLNVIVANDHSYPLFFQNTNGSWMEQLAIEGLNDSRPLTNFIHGGVWRCPASTLWIKPDTNVLEICYGYNAGGVVSDETADENFGLGGIPSSQTPITESSVIVPADTIAIGDVCQQQPRLTHNSLYGFALAAHQRHQGRANMVFCEGHVESPTLTFLFADTNDEALRRWNRDHQPHREKLP